ncbi:GreA/GreB family elongation factor [Bacillus infantis]|uniref:GreA/GreB family elongation factor n=1 Tax=Bacillus infantis TaxID=324767 RepID=UPI002004C15A|nr:GreA/GreB family elongation factor [Bacillus infantis]MCK6208460.1 GreA/GreB family elongation factor [Bacillus infantis]MCP1161479.1 GreA/GreB family elongation factor [Bacillus infantis]
MNHNYPCSKESFVEQLVYIDENIQELTSLYVSSTPVYERLKNFFNKYMLEVEDLIQRNRRNTIIPALPKVYIGTRVTVAYEEEDDTEEFVICFPGQTDPDAGCISFLSPVGRQLLLRNRGEKVMLKIPTGELPVIIKEITFAAPFSEEKQMTKEA